MTADDDPGASRQEHSGTATDDHTDQRRDDLAARACRDVSTASFDAPAPRLASHVVPERYDTGATVDVEAVHYGDPDDDSVVEVEVRLDDQRLAVTFDAARARELSLALAEAARFATECEGDQEGDR